MKDKLAKLLKLFLILSNSMFLLNPINQTSLLVILKDTIGTKFA